MARVRRRAALILQPAARRARHAGAENRRIRAPAHRRAGARDHRRARRGPEPRGMRARRGLREGIPRAAPVGDAAVRRYEGGRSMSERFVPPVRFSRLILKVNAFLLIALLLVAAFMGLVAYKQGWFVHQTVIHFVTPNALGINKGMPVQLYGFTVGSVSTMELAQDGVDVRLSIMTEYTPHIPTGSHAPHAPES